MRLFKYILFFVFFLGTFLVFSTVRSEERINGFSGITEPYPYLHGGSFSGIDVPLSPDPLIRYRWTNPSASDGLQVYYLAPEAVLAEPVTSFQNVHSLIGANPLVTVNGTGWIRIDFGVESAGWLEIESDDLSGSIEMSISEYNEPAIVNIGAESRIKTKTPVRYGNIYRLELNSELYEGVRFGWIHVKRFLQPWHIKGIRLVCQVKPVNYTGSFSCSDSMLTRIWYTGAYVVKLNLLEDYFSAILMDRGDRYSWTGDAHPAQACSLYAFSNYDFVKTNLQRTANENNNIESYSLYWVLSLIDYYMATGDNTFLENYIANVQAKLSHGQTVYHSAAGLGFFGWDERLGAGFENPDIEETRLAYGMLFIRACLEFSEAMKHDGRNDLYNYYNNLANQEINTLRTDKQWVNRLGLHASADALNAGFPDGSEQAAIFSRVFSQPQQRLSYSPFNQYFIIQALGNMNRYNEAIHSVKEYWGGQIEYGGTTFFEVFRPDWNDELGENNAVPNNQCGYTSLAHPWGAGVTEWLTENILGIKPTKPGFKTFDVLPHLGSQLTWVSGKVVTPHGTIEARFNVSTGDCRVAVPNNTTGRMGIPKVGKKVNRVTVNGSLAWNGSFHGVTGIGSGSEDGEFVYLQDVSPGTYTIAVTYSGKSPSFSETVAAYEANFIGVDSATAGNWGGVYGNDGYLLCNYNGDGNHVNVLPSYVQAVTLGKNGNISWSGETNDVRTLAGEAGNGFPRKAAGIITQDPIATYQTMTVDIQLKISSLSSPYQVALYFVDWDKGGRRSAVEMFDYTTKKLVSPLKIVRDYEGGKYLVYSYNRSSRFRINQVRGDNAVLSGIFFDTGSREAIIHLSDSNLVFASVVGGQPTGSREIVVTNAGVGELNWTVSASAGWLKITPGSGSDGERFYIAVDPAGVAAGSYTGWVTVSAGNAVNSPQQVNVSFTVYRQGGDDIPFGTFESPVQGATGVAGALAVTGWVLDDVEVASVQIFRNPVAGEGQDLVYIDRAMLVPGARPDVEQNYPGFPFNHQAGWGYMLLTNYLPGNGNGTFVLYAVAEDTTGHRVILGSKTITCDNEHSVKPFGTIDTPMQGEEISGSKYLNWGWVLTPMPHVIPKDGSTINVYVDGVYKGHPEYNLPRLDIDTLFPGYANSNGAIGYFYLDTTAYANGVHSIQWTATDSAGNTDGIGSRFFTTRNNRTDSVQGQTSFLSETDLVADRSPVYFKKGYNLDQPLEVAYSGESGVVSLSLEELERIEINFNYPDHEEWKVVEGFLWVGDKTRPLPIGSSLDREKGVFYWQAGPGFLGNYELVFYSRNRRGELRRQDIVVIIKTRQESAAIKRRYDEK